MLGSVVVAAVPNEGLPVLDVLLDSLERPIPAADADVSVADDVDAGAVLVDASPLLVLAADADSGFEADLFAPPPTPAEDPAEVLDVLASSALALRSCTAGGGPDLEALTGSSAVPVGPPGAAGVSQGQIVASSTSRE